MKLFKFTAITDRSPKFFMAETYKEALSKFPIQNVDYSLEEVARFTVFGPVLYKDSVTKNEKLYLSTVINNYIQEKQDEHNQNNTCHKKLFSKTFTPAS